MNRLETYDHIISGGGLAGSLLALMLKKQGLKPLVLEKRADLRKTNIDAGKSINLVLTAKGIAALDSVGITEDIIAITKPVFGRMIHSLEGELTYQPYGKEDDCNYSVSRSLLNQKLIELGEAQGVEYRFQSSVQAYDFEAKKLEVSTDNSPYDIKVKHLFATDGAGSPLRKNLMDFTQGHCEVDFLQHGYKELEITTELALKSGLEQKALHIWPRGEHMLMALPNQDASFTLTLYLSFAGFEKLQTAEAITHYFKKYFADTLPLLPDLVAQFQTNPIGKLGTVRAAPWSFADQLVLLGDAAHAIVPFFGQGMNASFQDCQVLMNFWKQYAPDWKKTFQSYDSYQKPNGDAIADMALENFIEMCDHVGKKDFLLKKQVESILAKKFPKTYRPRYSMVVYEQTPYSECQKTGRIQQRVLDKICQGMQNIEDLDLDLAEKIIETELATREAEA